MFLLPLMNRLVDSRDIMELQLKQSDCELVIRKKEALQPPEPVSPIVMPQYMPHAMFQTPPPAAVAAPAPSSPALRAPAPSSPPPAKTGNSSHTPLKCPMAGTLYRSPAPGEPPFVKVSACGFLLMAYQLRASLPKEQEKHIHN